MSFWGGMARGFKDAEAQRNVRDAATEREDARLKAAEWQNKTFEYSAQRDSILDKRAEDMTRVEQERYAAALATAEADKMYTRTTAASQVARDEAWKTRGWALTIDQWDATKDNTKQAQENADRIFNQSIAVFKSGEKKYTKESLRADRAEARAIAQNIYAKERDTVDDEVAKANMERRIAEFDVSVAQWDRQFGLTEKKFEVDKKFKDRSWNLELEKWDATKDSVEQAQENADRIFNQSLAAFKENSKRYTIESLRADRTEARVVADAIYSKERDVAGDDAAAQARDDRLGQFDIQVEQWNKQFGITERAADRADEQLEVTRTEQILALMPAGQAALLAGGKTKTPSDHTTITPEAMTAGSSAFMAQLADMGEDEQSSDFFQAAARSPGAQATIMSFMEAQAKKGNTVELSDMPKYFSYLGSAPGKGEAEAKEFMQSMLSGDANLSDKDTFIKGLTAMKNFRATKELFVQTSAPASLTDQTQQLGMWEKSVEMDAFRAVKGLPAEQQADVQRALAMLETKADRQEGLDALASLGYGRTLAMSGNYMEHPLIGSYYQDTEAAAPVVADPVVPPQPPAPVVDADVTTFDTWEEVGAARDKGFSGNVSVGGVLRFVNPLVVKSEDKNEEPAADLTTDALKPPTDIVDDSGFLGTGKTERPALPTGTEIDAMFGDVFNSPIGVEENAPDWDRTTSPVEGISIEEGIPGIEAAVKNFEVAPEGASRAAELRESQGVQMVIQELEDMGIEWPTNKEELGYFRDDLVSLVSDYKVEIPAEIMSKIIDKAKEKSGVGIIPQGDLDRIKRAKEADDKDTLDSLMNKYGVGPVTDAMGVGN